MKKLSKMEKEFEELKKTIKPEIVKLVVEAIVLRDKANAVLEQATKLADTHHFPFTDGEKDYIPHGTAEKWNEILDLVRNETTGWIDSYGDFEGWVSSSDRC